MSQAGRQACRGSIPACTGKPPARRLGRQVLLVYPRMYGETADDAPMLPRVPGLSPHVRGNPQHAGCHPPLRRSIPACTGKPRQSSKGWRTCWVYPRMYGETSPCCRTARDTGGLSPHVRGNHGRAGEDQARLGSIPACTGKPVGVGRPGSACAVYPRMYGETRFDSKRHAIEWGLSPHVRGNPRARDSPSPTRRSIPACTGKPARRFRVHPTATVYPRMYGETT